MGGTGSRPRRRPIRARGPGLQVALAWPGLQVALTWLVLLGAPPAVAVPLFDGTPTAPREIVDFAALPAGPALPLLGAASFIAGLAPEGLGSLPDRVHELVSTSPSEGPLAVYAGANLAGDVPRALFRAEAAPAASGKPRGAARATVTGLLALGLGFAAATITRAARAQKRARRLRTPTRRLAA